ncbi:MAG: NAD(P)/FAD-dependent oxidoreductase [Deltaproteobacteria bacterium]|nr:NAD(P)/FAD-dependent oxidoreductase [Deltaproteobacteria bacterium]MBW1932725.1 NAD(P)/FAD-dependent oxidoreductase [Deltaproteobacteria bacterium]MBW1964973.1 NAD(P)/FAD-dependent oxidoreductase [Deltaproteobacteria bacterium]MBW2080655.1 NAD(P)/FAD-dependent oxidoreductase [Deltaproteobacteria bacterium]
MQYAKVVIVGGGFGGLYVAKSLKKGPAEVLVIDKTNHHLFQPLLYQVASAALAPSDIARPIREILHKQKNAVVIMGKVIGIDKDKQKVLLSNGVEYDYDYLVMAVGNRHSYFGNDEWEQHAPGLKNLNDALLIRERILKSFERAERCDRISEAEKHLRFVIVGGGPTGVELAGSLAEVAHQTMLKNFRRINPDKSRIYLIESGPRLLPEFAKELSERAQKDLSELGVIVLTDTKVTGIDGTRVQIGEEQIETQNVIWAAGNKVSPLLKTLGAPLDSLGRVIVQPDMSIPDYPMVFVIGDAAHCKGKDGKLLPAMAPVAIQQAYYVAETIRQGTSPQERKPFSYFDKGQMATIGKKKALVMVGKYTFSGYFAWLVWCVIHIMYLIGYKNRIRVMAEWFYLYMTGGRGSRLINSELEYKEK